MEKAFATNSIQTNQQAQEFVEKWARDELENRGEGKELDILQFFERQEQKMQRITSDGLYEFMLKLKGEEVNVTFGQIDDQSNRISRVTGQFKE